MIDSAMMLRTAAKNGYAIPAFNFSDIWELLAILEAAQEEKACVYAASNMKVVASLGLAYTAAMGCTAMRETGGAALLHLDHCGTVEECNAAIDAGYASVMIDASACPLEENIARSRAVAAHAHARGKIVEAELGRIMGNNEEGAFGRGEFLAEVAECVRLAEEAGIDSLAVGIGNAHGFYKAPPHLNIQRLKEIHSAVSLPLVLHGGTGIPEDQIRACIRNGIAKVNVGTLLHSAYLRQLRQELPKEWGNYVIADRFAEVRRAVKRECITWIRLCGCDGSAEQG